MNNYNDAIFKGIFETALDAIITIDKNGIVQSVNQAMTALFQYSERELVGQPIEKLMPEPYAKAHGSYIKRYLETGEKHVIGTGRIVKARRKGGVIFPVFLSVNEFIIEDEHFFAGIIRDMTEQTANEMFLTDQADKLTLLNQELESFSYSVSHDLNTPLRHVIGYIELLNKHIENSEDERVKKYIKIITDEAFRMEGLIQSLLGFSRLGRASLEKSKFAFNDLINEVITHFQPETKNRNIDWQIAPLPEAYCDKKMLLMVWENLISNALKFTKNKEKTIIKISS
ncbi:MAG: PAS domain S-box protein, partial [Legionellaceae bacterium]|nr:PAS domain S-box protein [Legionellaceae bacterium]